MSSTKKLQTLVLLVILLLIATALIGLFWQGEGYTKIATAIDGREIELYGKGAYANHSILRATSYMGADLSILFTVVPILLVTAVCMEKFQRNLLICSGALMVAFYYSISLTFGAAINRYFLLYIALFSLSGFTLGYSVYQSGKIAWKHQNLSRTRNWGTSIFIFLAGASALIWLGMLVPAIMSGDFTEFIDINTTEPTFALDIGILFPLYISCAIALLKGKELGFWLTPILLTFYSLVGSMVAIQTLVQQRNGIEIPMPQMLSLVASFITLGAIALILNIRFMKRNIKPV